MKKIVIIDSNALVHRAYHALPPLTTKDGQPVGAVYGVALTFLSVLDKFKPDYIAAAFDLKAPTFRHQKFKDYKATRKKAPDELYQQIPLVKEMFKNFGVPIFEKEGFEADDLIGTICHQKSVEAIESIVVTGDMDTLQLVDENTKVFTLRKGINDTVVYDRHKVIERFGGLEPEKMVEYKALRGDVSDNIPGVKGIGEKTAIKLLLQFGTLEKIYENLEKIKPDSLKEKLEKEKEMAYLSRELATIKLDVPMEFSLDACSIKNYNQQNAANFFEKMQFHSLLKKVDPLRSTGEALDKQEKKLKIKVEIATELGTVESLVKKIGREVSIDFLFFEGSFQGLGFFAGQQKAYFIPAKWADQILIVLEKKEIIKYFFAIKNQLRQFFLAKDLEKEIKNEVINVFEKENFFDVELAHYLLKSGANRDLEKIIFGEFGAAINHKTTKSGQSNLFVDQSEGRMKEVAERAFWIFHLGGKYKREIQAESDKKKDGWTLLRLFNEIEMPLSKILAEMESAGVKIDQTVLKRASLVCEKKLTELEKEIFSLAGEEFNISSPLQLSKILFDKLKISTAGIRRGKTGFSTDSEQLQKIAKDHPIAELVNKYREVAKIKTTYADALPQAIDNDGRIRTNFNQTVATTGRLSSSNPNLQNIPKKGELANLIRSAFVSEKGKWLVSADYSQIDLRVAAHLSADQRMIEAFKKGKDIHRITAAWVNGIAESAVTDKQRNEAKSLNFGVLYGMGIYGFMRDSGIDRQRAEFFIKNYMEKFSSLKEYLEKTKEFAAKFGYVETQLGRRRYISGIDSKNYAVRSAAERMAINLPIQGLAADIMKLAMLEVNRKIMKKYKPSEAQLILQIHDELIFEVNDDLVTIFKKEVKKVMESVYQLEVPLVVEVSQGKNWAEL